MPPKPKNRNRWNDVQTTIAAISIAATLGLWNLFATPAKTVTAQTEEPTIPPTEPPVASEPAEAAMPTALAPIKIIFTPGAPQAAQITTAQQLQQQVQQVQKKKKKKSSNSGGGGGGGPVTVTQTKSS